MPPYLLVPGQCGGQHRLSDPALPVQPQRRPGHHRHTVPGPQHRRPQPGQLLPGHERPRQRRNPVHLPRPLTRGERLRPGRNGRQRGGNGRERGGAGGQQLAEDQAGPHDLAFRIGRARHRPVPARVVCPLQALQYRHRLPQARPNQYRDQLHPALQKSRQLLVHDEVRRQERRADQQQRRPRPGDRRRQLRPPRISGHHAVIGPHLQAARPHQRLEHLSEPAPPLLVLAAIAHEHHRATARQCSIAHRRARPSDPTTSASLTHPPPHAHHDRCRADESL